MCFSNGLLLHIASLGGTVRWMLRNDYEERVGINEGDYFMNNDPHIGGAHSPDQSLVTPIVHEGKVVGWAGGLIHVLETGATEPGGVCPSAISRFDEGIFWPCVKVAEKETLKADLENVVIRGTRTPLYWLLDSRASMAGDQVVRNGVLELIREFGAEFYLQAIYEYIEDSRQAARAKIQSTLFPGRYSHMVFTDIPHKNMPIRMARDYYIRIPCETTITPEGEIRIDFDGASPAGNHPNNSSVPCLTGNVVNCLIQYLLYDLKPNQGIFQAFDINVTPSVINPPIAAACSAFVTAVLASEISTLNVARAYYCSGYREEVTAGFLAGVGMITGGMDQYGRPFGLLNFEAMCAGSGAMGVYDGLHTCYAAMNPEGDFCDAEEWERMMPEMWLGRRIWLDSGGFGKYQGGGGIESLYFHEHSDLTEIGAAGGMGHNVHSIYGLMGGYPVACSYHHFVTETNLKECIDERRPLPHSEGDPANPEWLKMIRGKTQVLPGQVFSRPIRKYDIWQNFSFGGGGFGDPLERSPELVRRDLENDIISARAAQSLYGVAVDPLTGRVDEKKTEALRQEIRVSRKKRGLPVRDYLTRERQRILSGDLPEMPISCLNECLANSKKFLEEFRQFWALGEDFTQIRRKAEKDVAA